MVKLVGILNLTPDSFSDGGKFNDLENALEQNQKLIDEGADIIDIGAESTRPGAIPINHKIEWQRLQPILQDIIKLTHKNNKLVSLDSRHQQNVKKALNLGVDIINDVTGFDNKEMVVLARNSQKTIILMHNLGVPARKEVIIDENLDEIEEIKKWLISKIAYLEKQQIKKSNIIFDPGIGFGKNINQSINILNNIGKFMDLGIDILIGHSRKRFLNQLFENNNESIEQKDLNTKIISKKLVQKGVKYLRVHNVKIHSNIHPIDL